MKRLLSLIGAIALLIPGLLLAAYKINPYTGARDYYQRGTENVCVQDNQVPLWDNTLQQFVCGAVESAAGGTVSLVTGSNGIAVANGTSTPALSITDNAVSGGKIQDNTLTNDKFNFNGAYLWTRYGSGALNAAGTNSNYSAAFGYHALMASTANFNNAFGGEALLSATTGGGNAAFGSRSLRLLTTGQSNSAYGHDSMNSMVDGNYNVGVGFDSILSLTTGSYNTGVGYGAGMDIASGVEPTSGDNNTYIGANASPSDNTSRTNSTAIGANAKVALNNQMSLGNSNVTSFLFGGLSLYARFWSGTGDYLKYDGTRGTPAGGGTLSNVVEDTTPELGGNLDGRGYAINNVSSVTTSDPGDGLRKGNLRSNTTDPSGVNLSGGDYWLNSQDNVFRWRTPDNTTTRTLYDNNTPTTAYPAALARLASPTFTGDPLAPTATATDNDTSIATTAQVQAAIRTIKQSFAWGQDNVVVATDNNQYIWPNVPVPITIDNIVGHASTDNVVGRLYHCAADNLASCTAITAADMTITNATAPPFSTATFSSAAVAAGRWIKWAVTSVGTTNSNKLFLSIRYTVD